MKFFHLSDLHIGKQLHSYSLKEEQEAILTQIIEKTKEYQPDAVLLTGDIFDRSIPSGEAYELFDHFLLELSKTDIPILIIAGNHDSPQRLSYASSFLEQHRIYISTLPPQSEEEFLKKVTLQDAYGEVNFYLLPYTKPAHIRHLFDEGVITDYESGIRTLLERESIDFTKRNVLLSHQFYQAADWMVETSDSEQMIVSVGGSDRVDAALLKDFDYAALGHLHGPQRVKFPAVRYAGTPLKYSVSEEFHKKSITMVTLEEKGTPAIIETIPLVPIRDVRTIRGPLEKVLEEAKGDAAHDYVRVILTDEKEPVRPKEKLSLAFDHLLEYRIDNQRTRSILTEKENQMEHQTPLEAFFSFYEEIHRHPMTGEQKNYMEELILKTGEEEE
jgi:exonuclease SbcD